MSLYCHERELLYGRYRRKPLFNTLNSNLYRIEDDDDGAAEVDVTETRTQPKEYKHPENHDVSFVYLPGIGTSNYPDLPTYDKKVGLEDYDTFLIFTTTRFTKNDLELAKRVKSLGKPFFLIRTKIDVDLTPKKGTAAINEEAILRKIRNNCMDNVEDLISSEKEIFLISNYDTDKYDFNRLIEAMSELPVLQSQSKCSYISNCDLIEYTRHSVSLHTRP